MENKKKSLGINLKDTWFFVFSFIPLLQWIPFFIMNGKLPKKKYLITGFVYFFLIVVVILLPFIGNTYYENNRPSRPAGSPSSPDYPSVSDYCGDKYYEVENYSDTPEYKKYEEAVAAYYESDEYKQYEADLFAYMNSEEYKEYEQGLARVNVTRRSMRIAGDAIFCVACFLYFILGFFVERYRYLRGLEVNKNRGNVYGKLANRTDIGSEQRMNVANSVENNDEPVSKDIVRHKPAEVRTFDIMTKDELAEEKADSIDTTPKADIQEAAEGDRKININTATEEELMTLPGMKTIDAKKIINYRLTHGGFESIDDFFEAYEAKPHIMVKTMKLITLEKNNSNINSASTAFSDDVASGIQNKTSESRRRFDL